MIFAGSPRRSAAQASRRGSAVARGRSAFHEAPPAAISMMEWVNGMPSPGVTTTSACGTGESPPLAASSAADARAMLPFTSWCTDSASSRSLTASQASAAAAMIHETAAASCAVSGAHGPVR